MVGEKLISRRPDRQSVFRIARPAASGAFLVRAGNDHGAL